MRDVRVVWRAAKVAELLHPGAVKSTRGVWEIHYVVFKMYSHFRICKVLLPGAKARVCLSCDV